MSETIEKNTVLQNTVDLLLKIIMSLEFQATKEGWLIKQLWYCTTRDCEMFAPLDGKCFSCHKAIKDDCENRITGCPHCHRSFVE